MSTYLSSKRTGMVGGRRRVRVSMILRAVSELGLWLLERCCNGYNLYSWHQTSDMLTCTC